MSQDERIRRWTLALGVEESESERSALSASDLRMAQALSALYGDGEDGGKKGSGGLGASAPRVARWLGDIREFFPTPVVQVIQKDAFERKGLRQMLLEPEFLATVEADVSLVADLVALRSVMPEKTKETARIVIAKVVAELMERLERRTGDAIRGALDRSRRTNRPRFADIDWPRTIRANLRHYQAEHGTIVPERLVGFLRQQRRIADLDEVVLCVDQSGSMATSVVYASIFAAVMASLPVVATKLVCFDTAIVDLTEELADPVEVLFGVQLGGGTDINRAVAYCEERIERPAKSHLVLITDLYEGGDAEALLDRLARLVLSGVNVIVLLALTDSGRPSYDPALSAKVAALDIPVFACTPDEFPDLMGTALRREDIHSWAADRDIRLIRPDG
ncbi:MULTISPECIES: VWA domain-containing protein [unclassified Novosphingobium]|uniref:VWA domain-containing protein n=1 Tax=unclassified Novosphingobium TaxID=2644732 RepID=UPI00146A0BAA|nr:MULTISPECIES: VWA domain-containing protein [unclassified Novosphingobium]NMN05867.1 Mg-chelatase subunit ChlD [Novosphingobium sp. SG919]NMN87773.1 Mg-chelatase subunit ChlD [Novosphingobium sp. SG916]